jgi:hypothetical protein
VASSSSVEESERMYSGTSSVPKISSRSKSRLKQRKVNHEIQEQEKAKEKSKMEFEKVIPNEP